MQSDHEILVILIFLLSHTIYSTQWPPEAVNKTMPFLTAPRLLVKSSVFLQKLYRSIYCTHSVFSIDQRGCRQE